ncbi:MULTISPECIES: hypothetical protein [Maricaulis]|jgi:hypothetical protein|uniref:Uncharacterized protein n=1 Tax=Maricaulis maris (strain MCS10) TaxID=394221 RepID=Q0AKU7_MARMM|nr:MULTISPECIES: hypothetical protein [Maricaulis]ABI67096.1 hypothetical protein Mmar10_2815 [Maricaulis maris MCS10]MAC89955.1 hypothetical protein [Maricaulis sp.]
MPRLRQALIVLAILRGAYGLRSPLAGYLHQLGLEGQLGFTGAVTRTLAETGVLLSALALVVQLGYFVVAWAFWRSSKWLVWIALAVYLVDQAMWIGFSLRPEDVAAHEQERVDQNFDPEFLDWAMFTLETLIAAGALALGVRAATGRN